MSTALDRHPPVSSQPPRRDLCVTCVQDHWGFTTLRHEWRELLESSDCNNPFLTWEWLSAWWTHFGSADGLRLIVVRADQKLIAIAPLHLVATSLPWFSRLEFLGTGVAGSDYLDVIVRRGSDAAAAAAIAGYLAGQQLAVRLTHLPPASISVRLAERLADAGWTTSFTADGTCPIVALAGHTFDSFLNTLGASHRANIRRRLRAIERDFDVRFERVTRHENRRAALDRLAAFHERRYAERGGSTAFSTDTARAFHDDATRRGLERGWLRMYVLKLDERIAAVMYGFNDGGRFYFYQHGYDDAYASHSVGLVLMALTIRAAIDEGAGEFDMLWGTEPYKSLWARSALVLQRADLFPAHLAGAMQRHAVGARRGVTELARRVRSLRSFGATRVR
jgi:CelD/BcsL family acetyltransferase involved in cellulose biosynthesis